MRHEALPVAIEFLSVDGACKSVRLFGERRESDFVELRDLNGPCANETTSQHRNVFDRKQRRLQIFRFIEDDDRALASFEVREQIELQMKASLRIPTVGNVGWLVFQIHRAECFDDRSIIENILLRDATGGCAAQGALSGACAFPTVFDDREERCTQSFACRGRSA